jgi:hypothetical protein
MFVKDKEYWNELAEKLKLEFGESLVQEEDDESDPYNWWLTDVTVTDIIEFLKNNLKH